jgi:hypothetical protein
LRQEAAVQDVYGHLEYAQQTRAHATTLETMTMMPDTTTPPSTPPSAEPENWPRVIVACHDCGLAYGSEGWIECIVPNGVWREISPTHDEGGILCITCIARRLKRAGSSSVPVMLCGTEAIRAADQEESFDRGWSAAAKRIGELEAEISRLSSRSAEDRSDTDDTRLVNWLEKRGYVEATDAGNEDPNRFEFHGAFQSFRSALRKHIDRCAARTASPRESHE